MTEEQDIHEGPVAPLGAAVSFFQCGSDLEIQATSEGLRRMAAVLDELAGAEMLGVTGYSFRNPHSEDGGTFTADQVAALATSSDHSKGPKPAGRNYVVPVASVLDIIGMLVLPVVGVGAILWSLFNRLVGAP